VRTPSDKVSLHRQVRRDFARVSGHTTQDADLFIEKSTENGQKLVQTLRDLGFSLSAQEAEEIRRGKDFIQLKNGPFDLDLIFAPDGIERFDDAWNRRVDVEGFPVCDITTSYRANAQPTARKIKNRYPG